MRCVTTPPRTEPPHIFEATFEGAPDAMILIDDAGACVRANAAAHALYGLDEGQLLGRSAFDLAGDHQDAEGAWRTLMGTGHVSGEIGLARADGSVRRVEYSARANVLPG